MDKKKVIENLKQVELYINKLKGLDYTQLQLLKSAIFRLHDAQDELKKSDWISVEDELPPRDTYVWVRSIANPNVVWTARRATLKEFDTESLDSNDFITFGHSSITHWHKIDEL